LTDFRQIICKSGDKIANPATLFDQRLGAARFCSIERILALCKAASDWSSGPLSFTLSKRLSLPF